MYIDLQDLDVEQSDRLGLAFPAGDYETYAALADAGFGRVRIGVSWDRIQSAPWRWEFEGLDAQITILASLGLEPLLTFYSDADWATRSGDNRALNEIPWTMTWWQGFIGKTASRYADFVDEYQVANEFAGLNNESGGWGGRPDQLVDYVDTAYAAVKAADPDATFVMGGVASFVADIALVNLGYATFEPFQPLSPTTETRYTVEEARSPEMDALVESRLLYPLRNARYDKADVHLYGDRGLDALRVEMLEAVTGRPVISSESGAPTVMGTAEPSSVDYFAASVLGDLSALAAGAETVYWFLDYDAATTYYNRFVPLRDAEGEPKPSFWAKKLLATYLVDDATVTALDGGLFHIQSVSEGAALIGFVAELEAAAREAAVAISDIWVLEDPEAGRLRRLEPGESLAPGDFVAADTGWLAAAAAETPDEPDGVLTGSSTVSFLRAVTDRTRVEMLRDGDVVDTFWYTGDLALPSAELDRIGLTLQAGGESDGALGLGHGVMGVASAGESGDGASRIDLDERLAIGIAPTDRPDDRPVLRIAADGVEDGETIRFAAYRDGARVSSAEAPLTDDVILFDPGPGVDRIEIGAGADTDFSVKLLEIFWYSGGHDLFE